MEKKDVLNLIDEVMNNREIDSIRNAILAIRNKVLELPELEISNDKKTVPSRALLKLQGNNPITNVCYGSAEDAKYVFIDTTEKIDTGTYGCLYYFKTIHQFLNWGFDGAESILARSTDGQKRI